MRDSLIERVALILTGELEREAHPTQSLIVDALSCALASHLLRSYNAFGPVEPAPAPPLGRIEIARLTEYIEDNLGRKIGLAELAALVNVSRFHFARLFKRSTGMTAIAFVEQCRIRRAQALLVESTIALADISLITGFADQSHFTRRFHRHVGCTPAVFAQAKGRRRPKRTK
jgi:AraC family transcriptional regulator